MVASGLLWFVLAGAAVQPSPSAWRLRGNLTALDSPGSGRYTQVRADYHGIATIVWNGDCEGKGPFSFLSPIRGLTKPAAWLGRCARGGGQPPWRRLGAGRRLRVDRSARA